MVKSLFFGVIDASLSGPLADFGGFWGLIQGLLIAVFVTLASVQFLRKLGRDD